jgi:glycosyltransferase involved in cell wall biosynthesis
LQRPERIPLLQPLPVVSVIIPTRDSASTLLETLRSLSNQKFDGDYEVIVVDDGSTDDPGEIAEQFAPLVRLIRTHQCRGPGAARNAGVREARGPVLAFTDADCLPTPNWLAEGLIALKCGADLVQGLVAPDPTVTRTPFDRTLAVDDHEGFYQTANLFVRREVFETVGGFHDWALERPRRRAFAPDRRRGRAARTPIGEDTVFAWSARRLGARSAFAAAATVYHAVVPGTIADDIADHWHWSRDMAGLVRLVPELRKTQLYRRVFFNAWTAQFDLAVAGLLLASARRDPRHLLGGLPYAWRMARDARRYGRRGAFRFLVGTPLVEAATLVGLLTGSVAWRSLVL